MKRVMIDDSQKRKIHTWVGELHWSREMYVTMMEDRYGVCSCVDLTWDEAEDFIKTLRMLYFGMKEDSKVTQKQVNYIKFLWIGVDYGGCTEGDRYLRSFLLKRYGVESPEELSRQQAMGAISAIKRMQKNLNAKQGTVAVSHTTIDHNTGEKTAWVTLPDGKRVACHIDTKTIQ